MRTRPPWNPLPARAFAHRRQTVINLSWKSAGSGLESLAAHKATDPTLVITAKATIYDDWTPEER